MIKELVDIWIDGGLSAITGELIDEWLEGVMDERKDECNHTKTFSALEDFSEHLYY